MNKNNSDYWYTESEAQSLLGYAQKSSVKNLRDKVETRKISNRTLYSRKDINAFVNELDIAKEIFAMKPYKDYNIDFDVWIPLSDALEIVTFSRQRLYQIRDRLQTKKYDGFTLFNKEELKNLSD